MSRDRLWVISVASDPTGMLIPPRAPALAVLADGVNAGKKCWVNHTTDAARWSPVFVGSNQLDALDDLTAQIGEGKTELISETDSSALAEMVAADFVVANDVDPSATGLAAPVGSRARTANGALAWIKYGTAATAWRSLNETRARVVAEGGPFLALDLNVSVPAGRGVTMDVLGKATTPAAWVGLRVDGAPPSNPSGALWTDAVFQWSGNVIIMGSSVFSSARIVLGRYSGGMRRVDLVATYAGVDKWNYSVRGVGFIANAEISSLGLLHGSGFAEIADGTTIDATIAEFGVNP